MLSDEETEKKFKEMRLVIAVPENEMWGKGTSMLWAMALAVLMKPDVVQFKADAACPLSICRNRLLRTFHDSDYDWLLFLDDDVVPPYDAILQLLKYSDEYDILSGLYFRKSIRKAHKPVAFQNMHQDKSGRWWWNSLARWPKGACEVGGFGLGFCLIPKYAIKQMIEKQGHPLCHYSQDYSDGWLIDGEPDYFSMGEDLYFCLPLNQQVIGEGVSRNVQDIDIGDRVLTHKATLHEVKSLFKRNYEGELITIKSRFTLPFKVTENHPIYVKRYIHIGGYVEGIGFYGNKLLSPKGYAKRVWIKASSLEKKDRLFIPKGRYVGREKRVIKCKKYQTIGVGSKNIPDRVYIDEEIAFLLGLYIAEGAVGRQPTLTMHRDEREILEKAKGIIKRRFNVNSSFKTYRDSKRLHLVSTSKSFGNFLKDLIGKGAYNKHLPQFWRKINQKYLTEMLRGYLIGDGCIRPDSCPKLISHCTISPILARQLQQAFLSLDILTILREDKREGNNVFTGTIPTAMQNRLSDKLNLDIETYHDNRKYGAFSEVSNGFWVKIDSLEKECYSGEVYNFEVNPIDSYVVEGIAVHNCKKAKDSGLKLGLVTTATCEHTGPNMAVSEQDFLKSFSEGRLLGQVDNLAITNVDQKLVALDLATYLHLKPKDAIKNISFGTSMMNALLSKTELKTQEDRNNFYLEHPDYLYHMIGWNYFYYDKVNPKTQLALISEGSVLDYGGGCGDVSVKCSQLGLKVTYYDHPGIAFDFVKWRAKTHDYKNIDFVELEENKDTLGDKKYDTIVCFDFLEFTVNPVKHLKRMKKHAHEKTKYLLGLNTDISQDNLLRILHKERLDDMLVKAGMDPSIIVPSERKKLPGIQDEKFKTVNRM